ncbi:conjugal transfer pilus assembly protein TraL [Alphaproteobacteria bacterium]
MYDRNVILRYLDNPTRIAFWTIDEISMLFLPSMLGCIFGFPVSGLFISIVSYVMLKFFKNNMGGGVLKHATYWYLPLLHRSMKIKIPSYIREYIG